MRATAWCLVASVLIGVAACDSPTGPGGADIVLEIVGEPIADEGGSGFAIAFRVRNRGSELARIAPRCGESVTPIVHERTGRFWESVGGGYCLTVVDQSPWPLAPGETFEGTIRWTDEGTFRLEVLVTDAEGDSEISVSSGPFRLER